MEAEEGESGGKEGRRTRAEVVGWMVDGQFAIDGHGWRGGWIDGRIDGRHKKGANLGESGVMKIDGVHSFDPSAGWAAACASLQKVVRPMLLLGVKLSFRGARSQLACP